MSQDLRDQVAGEVRAHLARQKLNQQDLAGVLNMSRQAVSRRLVGVVAFNVEELDKIADLLHVPVIDLFREPQAA